MMQMQTAEFRTPDLYFAAFLQTAGVRMKRADRDGRRIFFIFDASLADIEALKAAWLNNTAKVPAQPFAFNIKALKGVCHAE